LIGDTNEISLSPDLQFDLKDSISKTDPPVQTDHVSSNIQHFLKSILG